jgi:hypothetical protein
MAEVSIHDLMEARLTRMEKLIRFYDQLKFYLKATLIPDSQEERTYENHKASYEMIFPGQKYGLSNMPHRFAVRQGAGILSEHIEKNGGRKLTQGEIDKFLAEE